MAFATFDHREPSHAAQRDVDQRHVPTLPSRPYGPPSTPHDDQALPKPSLIRLAEPNCNSRHPERGGVTHRRDSGWR